jgi:hypothetical protein
MNIVLMHPPLDDPTLPYHSTAYLAGQLRHHGFTSVSLRDINIEFVNFCLRADSVDWFCQAADTIRRRLRDRASLNFQE